MNISVALAIILSISGTNYLNAASLESYIKKRNAVIVDKFQDKESAVLNGCNIVALKNPHNTNCVLEKIEDRTIKLIVYDLNAAGEFVRSEELCVPSWYDKADVKYVDLLGDGKQFMSIEFDGAGGTGTLQMILMVIGWHSDKFLPVLLETIDYHMMERADLAELKVDHAFENIGTPRVAMVLKYNFQALDEREFPYRFNASWMETLPWNKDMFSFYYPAAEKRKFWNVPCSLPRNIAKARLKIKDLDVRKLCDELFEVTRIHLIMDPDECN